MKKDTAQERSKEEQPGCRPESNGSVETISYEEAIQRELEYQKWIKKRTLPPFAGPELPPSSQDLPSKSNFIETNREEVSLPLPQQLLRRPHDQHSQPLHQQSHDQHYPPQHHDQQVPSPRLQFKQPSPHEFQLRRPLLQPPYQKTSQQIRLQHRQTFLRTRHQLQKWQQPPKQQLHDQQPQQLNAQQPLSSHEGPLWCNVCQVPCMTAFNLKQHQQGKKHQAKWEVVFGGKNTGKKRPLWCNECSIPCMDEMAMAQHCVGKKHAASLLAIKAEQTERDRVATAGHGVRRGIGGEHGWC